MKVRLPPYSKKSAGGNGTRDKGDKLARPLDLKITYKIGRDTAPIQYIGNGLDFTIKTEVSGEISLEIVTDYKQRHSLELVASKNPLEIKQKLHQAYDPALTALMAEPEMVFESGKVEFKAPIVTEANAGPYTIKVQADAPNHMTGTLKPPTLNGNIMVKGTRYKYGADLELKTEVIWHPSPKGVNETPVRVTEIHREKVVRESSKNSIDWSKVGKHADETIAVVTITILSYFFPQLRMTTTGTGATISFMPFTHSIGPRRHGYSPEA